MNEAKHASAPPGYKCSDCTMDDEPCPRCYTAWWQARHPDTYMVSVGDSELNALRAELEACRKQLQIKERAARTAFDHIFGVASEYWDGNYERDAARAQAGGK